MHAGLHVALIGDGAEIAAAELRQAGLRHAVDQLIVPQAVANDVAHREQHQPMLARESEQLRPPRHGAVRAHHLADHPSRREPRHPGEVDRALRLAGAHQNAALPGAQREHVPRADQIARLGVGRHRHLDRAGSIRGGDPGGDAGGRLDRHGEGGAERRGVLLDHQRQAQLADPVLGQGEADQPAAVRGHEVDGLGSHLLRGHHQIALVLPSLVVGEDHHPPAADVLQRALDERDAVLVAMGRSGHRLTPCRG